MPTGRHLPQQVSFRPTLKNIINDPLSSTGLLTKSTPDETTATRSRDCLLSIRRNASVNPDNLSHLRFSNDYRSQEMSNNIRATRSNSTLVPPTCDLERILRDQDLSFHAVFRHENPGRAGSIERDLYSEPGICLAGSRRSASVSMVTGTIGSCSNQPRK